ncbi:hypothetical protein C8R41DRAFT_925710 [Lentinula lateritia]|uniref:Uncharacterized protein n=1 Tax=Lentinula lateritia TaxID=40482 RepID=A0ABQ8V037_9AGAR|nr:hypothetical protein C8R41DRAFT_925710 [Lentinula lateritia]
MGRLRRSSQSKVNVSGCRTVKPSRLPPRSHPMILRRASAQSRPASANTVPPASYATPVPSDTAPATFNASLTSDSAALTTFDASSLDSSMSNRHDFVFAKQIHNYMIHSTGILQAQTETLVLLTQKLTSLNQIKESLEHDTEQEMNIRTAEVRCPLCSGLAWNPHV